MNEEDNFEVVVFCLILAIPEFRSRLSKSSISTLYEESTSSSLQFHLSINDDTDDGIVSDADDSLTEDDDQVFRTPVDANSAPPSPATIIAVDVPPPSSSLLIEVYSVYRDFSQALEHLNKKLIATYAPETIRGGGLLVKRIFSFVSIFIRHCLSDRNIVIFWHRIIKFMMLVKCFECNDTCVRDFLLIIKLNLNNDMLLINM